MDEPDPAGVVGICIHDHAQAVGGEGDVGRQRRRHVLVPTHIVGDVCEQRMSRLQHFDGDQCLIQ